MYIYIYKANSSSLLVENSFSVRSFSLFEMNQIVKDLNDGIKLFYLNKCDHFKENVSIFIVFKKQINTCNKKEFAKIPKKQMDKFN